jgi:hypothetical protein
MLVVPAVEEEPRAVPPTSPTIGSCYIVSETPSGVWVGKAHCLAAYTIGGWRFVEPLDGMDVYVRSTSARAIYRGGAWELAAATIASPIGGATIDIEARSAIDQILSALRQHGLIAT